MRAKNQKLSKNKKARVAAVKIAAPHSRRWAIITALCLVFIAVVWFGGNLFYSRIAVGDTLLSGHVSDTALKQSLAGRLASYRLAITYPDHSVKFFALPTVGLTANTEATLSAVRQEQHSLWHRLVWWRPVPVTVVANINKTTLATFAQQQARIVTQPPHDATLVIDNGAVTLNKGTPGTAYGLNNADKVIAAAASNLRNTPLRLEPVAIQPAITAETLASLKAQVESILKQEITLHIGDQTVSPNPSDISSWLIIKPGEAQTITVDNGKINDYLSGKASANSQAPHSQVVDSGGNVLLAGQQGISAPDTQAAADQISQSLLEAKGIQLTLNAQYTAFKTVTAPTSGKWIEVDVTKKHLYAYDNNALVRDFLVSAGAPGTPTVLGRYAIYAKYTSQNMFGENVDGSRYFQPDVPYVNYFYADYAIHGNYWRPSSYFGLINSSHGCVGLPVSDSEWVYDWAPVGTPVVVHT